METNYDGREGVRTELQMQQEYRDVYLRGSRSCCADFCCALLESPGDWL